MQKKMTTLLGALALGVNVGVFASGALQEAEMPVIADGYIPGVYIGAEIGYGLSGFGNMKDNVLFSFMGYQEKLKTKHESSMAERVFLGYSFDKNFDIELGYTYFNSKTKLYKHFVGGLITPDQLVAKISTQALDLTGKIKVPLSEMFSIYGRVGVAYLMSHGLQNGDMYAQNLFSKNNLNSLTAAYGCGVNYNITPNVIADLSWLQYYGKPSWKMNVAQQYTEYQPSVNVFGVGLAYKFNM